MRENAAFVISVTSTLHKSVTDDTHLSVTDTLHLSVTVDTTCQSLLLCTRPSLPQRDADGPVRFVDESNLAVEGRSPPLELVLVSDLW